MTYRVTVAKRLTFTVRADTPDEARALALVTADGAGNGNTAPRVRFLERALTVERCEGPGSLPSDPPEGRSEEPS